MCVFPDWAGGFTSLNNACILSLTLLCIFVERITSDAPELQYGKSYVEVFS